MAPVSNRFKSDDTFDPIKNVDKCYVWQILNTFENFEIDVRIQQVLTSELMSSSSPQVTFYEDTCIQCIDH